MKSCYLIKIIISFVLFPSLYIFAEEGFYLLGTMTGKGENDCYYHVAGVGDVNGDGYDDSMVGASAGGYADLYLGSALFDTLPDIVFRPPTQGATYGKTICGDDWNGDGYSDIAIGEPHWCFGEYPDAILQAGKVWVYFGGEQIDTIPDLELVVGDLEEFSGWYYRFGSSIADGGDLTAGSISISADRRWTMNMMCYWKERIIWICLEARLTLPVILIGMGLMI